MVKCQFCYPFIWSNWFKSFAKGSLLPTKSPERPRYYRWCLCAARGTCAACLTHRADGALGAIDAGTNDPYQRPGLKEWCKTKVRTQWGKSEDIMWRNSVVQYSCPLSPFHVVPPSPFWGAGVVEEEEEEVVEVVVVAVVSSSRRNSRSSSSHQNFRTSSRRSRSRSIGVGVAVVLVLVLVLILALVLVGVGVGVWFS